MIFYVLAGFSGNTILAGANDLRRTGSDVGSYMSEILAKLAPLQKPNR